MFPRLSVNIGVTMEFLNTVIPEHSCNRNEFHTLFEVKGSLCFASENGGVLQIFAFEKKRRRLDSYKFVGTTGDIDSSTTDYSDVVKIVMRYEDKLFYYDLKSHQYKNIAHLNNKEGFCIEINNRVRFGVSYFFMQVVLSSRGKLKHCNSLVYVRIMLI
ncbi:hypothetical protein IFM89_017366 [Coptis chinensis]|uniref:Uncharacterized protein n=1 Tax=Coptis chinensis TaxID=261450 RepID=A0A835LMK7_9MAGN|nr:hypothetical protein IFM89_017366 [Coptis chinensis]